MNKVIYMFAILGILFTFFTLSWFIVKKVREYNANKPRNKEKDYLNDYDYLDKEDFMENYRFCNNCNCYFDGKEEYQCMCYAR